VRRTIAGRPRNRPAEANADPRYFPKGYVGYWPKHFTGGALSAKHCNAWQGGQQSHSSRAAGAGT
jgi:hypothetical protein